MTHSTHLIMEVQLHTFEHLGIFNNTTEQTFNFFGLADQGCIDQLFEPKDSFKRFEEIYLKKCMY